MKHTKGPWRQHGEIINSDEREIAIIPNFKSKKDNANARLIAAAPDLLEVAKMSLDAIKAMYGYQNSTLVEILEKVINKAEGSLK